MSRREGAFIRSPWMWVLTGLGVLVIALVIGLIVSQPDREEIVQQPVPVPAPTTPPSAPPAAAPQLQPSPTPGGSSGEASRPRPAPSTGTRGRQTETAPETATNVTGTHAESNLPGQFDYQGGTWSASGNPIRPDANLYLVETRDKVDDHVIYVPEDTQKPYDKIYLRLTDGSGRYLVYERAPEAA